MKYELSKLDRRFRKAARNLGAKTWEPSPLDLAGRVLLYDGDGSRLGVYRLEIESKQSFKVHSSAPDGPQTRNYSVKRMGD